MARVSSLEARAHKNEASIPNQDLSVLSHVAMVPSPEARVSSHDKSEFLALALKVWILRHEACTPRPVARISKYKYKFPKCKVRDLGHESSIPNHDSSVPSHEAKIF